MFNWIKKLINKIKQERAYRKRLKELKKKDPFIYKQDMEILNKEKLQLILKKWKGHPSITGLMEKFSQLQSYTNKNYKTLESYRQQKLIVGLRRREHEVVSTLIDFADEKWMNLLNAKILNSDI